MMKLRKDLDDLKAAEIRALQQLKKIQEKQPPQTSGTQFSENCDTSETKVKLEETSSDEKDQEGPRDLDAVKTEVDSKVGDICFCSHMVLYPVYCIQFRPGFGLILSGNYE